MHQRYQTPYTALCNGVVRHGAQFGGLQVFVDHTRKGNRKTNALTSFVRHAAFYTHVCLHAYTAVHAVNTHLTNHDYIDYRKNPKTPK